MGPPFLPVTAVLLTGAGLGIAGDYLLRSPGGPGLNLTLLFLGLAVAVVVMSLRGGTRLSLEARICLAVGVLFGAALSWRGSELLNLTAFLAASLAFTLPALRAGRAWLRSASVADLCEAVIGSGLHSSLGSIRLLQRIRGKSGASTSETEAEKWTDAVGSSLRSVLVGSLMAVVPLVVFGTLLMSADPVFAEAMGDFIRVDLEMLASHVALVGILSWLASGYLAGFSTGTRLDPIRELGWVRPSLRVGEAAVALGLVDLLFLAFVTVQFRYLFGGQELVEVTPGLTYAAYAREGFFELVVATTLGLPWLLTIDSLVGRKGGPGRWIFRALGGAQLVLLLVVVVSAVQRMRSYLDVYGLTEDRFMAMAVLGWSALLILWFAATVPRERRNVFAFGALVSGFGLVGVLQVANPAALSARSHLDRAVEPAQAGSDVRSREVDVPYLASLGSDAAPVLARRIGELDERGRCLVARRLLARWGPRQDFDWRSWSYADFRARETVGARVTLLRAAAGGGEGCQPATGATAASSRDRTPI